MTRLARSLALVFALVAGGASAAGLTEAEVRTVVEAAEAATARNDVAGQVAHFADDAVISMTQRGGDGVPRRSTRSKQEFVDAESDSQVRLRDSHYTSKIERVEMSADGATAKVHMTIEQSFTHRGRKTVATGEQVMTVAQRDGKAVIVAVDTNASGLQIDGVKIY